MFVRIILGHPVYFLNNHGQLWFKKYITLIRNYETVRVKKVCTPLLKKSVEYLYLNKENIKICPANFSKKKVANVRVVWHQKWDILYVYMHYLSKNESALTPNHFVAKPSINVHHLRRDKSIQRSYILIMYIWN